MHTKELIQYVRPDGRIPFREWLLHLRAPQARARVRTRLDRLSLGNPGDCKPVGEGVSEIRIRYGPGYRIYFAEHSGKIIILLCGGDKSSQRKDIKVAQEYWQDFKRRQS